MGMGLATTFVMTLAVDMRWPLDTGYFLPLDLDLSARTLAFITLVRCCGRLPKWLCGKPARRYTAC